MLSTQALVISFAALVAILFTARWVSPRIHLPEPSVQFLLGALVANAVVLAGVDTGLRYQNFHDMVFYLFLPLLVFAAAYQVHAREFTNQLTSIAGLAVVGLIITSALVSLGVYYGIGHATGFPWHAALITGVLLAATDPAAVTGQAKQLDLPEKTGVLLEGESLLNDATSVVLFSVVLSLALMPTATMSSTAIAQHASLDFLRELVGGLLIGAAAALLGRLGSWLLDQGSLAGDANALLWLGLLLAFGAYHAALAVHASGVIACLLCGLLLNPTRAGADAAQNEDIHAAVNAQWSFLSSTTNGILFALMGATITISMFAERWLAMLIAIGAVLVARLIGVHLVLALSSLIRRKPLDIGEHTLIGLLGMRGSITLALVLILPYELDYWWTVQSIAYGVVLFDLFLLAPVAPRLISILKSRAT